MTLAISIQAESKFLAAQNTINFLMCGDGMTKQQIDCK